ncbi:hypothetical protein J7394_18085 [Ruegeria sp. R13_0]|uniref:hypothetical protein n=1 Tax=Ruegeria sp. R13_0 TaxID=2821099 RepID=UPI001ADCCF08|nr:hypothetical protein [Ruegeria sp. R13_0]MBO9436137.1 hypothetical protein [Ruegeria sp. R13_0]
MNSQALGELASDQKIEKVFHAYGYSIPVGKDGRRLWPRKFKNEVGQRMRTGRLSTRDVAKTCGISSGTASEWKKDAERKAPGPHSTLKVKSQPVFAEIKVDAVEEPMPVAQGHIIFKRGTCEVLLPSNYPLNQLTALIKSFEGDT